MTTDDFHVLPVIFRGHGRGIACDHSKLRLKEDMYVCPKCLKKFTDDVDDCHIKNCHPRFASPVFRQLSKLIVHITPDSPETEKRILERLSKCSAIDQQYPHPVLRKNKWIRSGWHMHAYLLTDRDEIASYIVIGRVNSLEHDEFGLFHRDIIVDMFTASDRRHKGNMTLLLPIVLKDMYHTFNSVWFQEPISTEGEKFLNNMSTKTGLPYRIC